jgi:hypothetical protein
MLLNVEELMKVNLKGFKFNDPYQGMTMTSRSAWIDDYYIVLEDDGENCIIASLDKRTYTKKCSKKYTASKIAYGTLCVWNEETKSHDNDIEKF